MSDLQLPDFWDTPPLDMPSLTLPSASTQRCCFFISKEKRCINNANNNNVFCDSCTSYYTDTPFKKCRYNNSCKKLTKVRYCMDHLEKRLNKLEYPVRYLSDNTVGAESLTSIRYSKSPINVVTSILDSKSNDDEKVDD